MLSVNHRLFYIASGTAAAILVVCGVVFNFDNGMTARAVEPPARVCGNGTIEAPNDAGIAEQCDDGNRTNGDGCNDDIAQGGTCRFSCGDGAVQAPNGTGLYEVCDTAGKGYCTNNAQRACSVDGDCGVNQRCIQSCTATCGANLIGWGWSSTFGWLSLASDNCDHLDPAILHSPQTPEQVRTICNSYPSSTTYGVSIDSTADHNVSGWAWSDNIGWVCFGVSCAAVPNTHGTQAPTNQPTGAQSWWSMLVANQIESAQVRGWGKILLAGDNGWLSFNCANNTEDINPTNDSCSTVPYVTSVVSTYVPVHGDTTHKVLRKTLAGWAWSGGPNQQGFGWLNFSADTQSAGSWLETRLGDIYAKRGIQSDAPIGKFNATYRILSDSGSVQALSAGGQGFITPVYGPIDFPTAQTKYTNVLGKVDVARMLCEFVNSETQQTTSSCVNAYGTTVVRAQQNNFTGTLDLAGKIWYVAGDLRIDSSLMIANSHDPFGSGAGTIIVDGDLIINAPIIYDTGSAITRFQNVAAVAWLVRGDVKIAPTVTEADGNFIVLGKTTSASCDNNAVGCGQVFTCYNTVTNQVADTIACSANDLKVSGLMMAKKFSFGRRTTGQQQGSELIIYDGRLLANTPPGLADFAQALPLWRSGTFVR